MPVADLPPVRFPYTLTVRLPFPTPRLAKIALRSLSVDKELSTLVTKSYSIEEDMVLVVRYAATTNRMLRVATNGFFESVGVVLHTMEELDVDVVSRPTKESLAGVQGLNEGVHATVS